jgi:hypothetical protein
MLYCVLRCSDLFRPRRSFSLSAAVESSRGTGHAHQPACLPACAPVLPLSLAPPHLLAAAGWLAGWGLVLDREVFG